MPPRPVLTARWVNLALVTWAVPPAVLEPHLPPGCEPDLIDGSAFVSLVAFDFLDTRVLGVPWPGFVDFPEINLRYYVRHDGRRGVTFVRELVPSKLVSLVARTLYDEPYAAARMTSRTRQEGARRTVTHQVVWRGKTCRLEMSGTLPSALSSPRSLEHFLKEHDVGYGRSRRGRLVAYSVAHPPWDVLKDPTLRLDWDFGHVYGRDWAFLGDARPRSLVFAEGSGVAVYPASTT
jgi:uncharacterized protein YqjF (DUF2071 family)